MTKFKLLQLSSRPSPTACHKHFALLLLVALASIFSATARSEETSAPAPIMEEGSKSEVMWEFDPYYTDVAFFTPLTNAPVPVITSDREVDIYSKLITGSAIPRYMLLEASVYPMPALGSFLKGHAPGFYNQGGNRQ